MKRISFVLFFLFTFGIIMGQGEPARLLRFPTASSTHIVFSHAGDLYSVARSGGTARKLTSHEGYEVFPKFSPDGKYIAFTGQYDGNTEVYLIPAEGGTPTRLTWTATLGRDDLADRMGPNNIVMAWTPDSKSIVYRTRAYSFNSFKGQLFKVDAAGSGESVQLPFSVASWCSYNPRNGKQMVLNKVFREFRTWKYYEGGMADDVWMYEEGKGKMERLFENKAQDVQPMWYDDQIFFISDRDRTMNLFSFNLGDRSTRKVSDFTDYDIKYPSLGGEAIVFEQAGYIWLHDLKNGSTEKVDIRIENDAVWGRDARVDASKNITNWDMSPGGERLLLSARGDIWSLPSKEGITHNLTRTSGVHERDAVWSPDGKWIAYVSDETGEDEIWLRAADGEGDAKQLTKKGDTYKYEIEWSPDSKKLLWGDKKLRLQYIDVASGKVTLVEQAGAWEIRSFSWSPDSKWIAYDMPLPLANSRIRLYNLSTKSKTDVTEGWYEVSQPTFGPEGKYLYFESARTYNPIYSSTEWNHAYTDMNKLYLVTLSKETPSPFEPENDRVGEDKDEKEDRDEDKKESGRKALTDIKVDLDGIQNRAVELPIDASNYFGFNPSHHGIYYLRNGFSDEKTQAFYFDLKKKKEMELGQLDGLQISHNLKKMAVRKGKDYYIVRAEREKPELKHHVDLSGMTVKIDLAAEWEQIFNETWRQMRDFFYDPGMHGVDWEAMQKKYAALLPYVHHRNDLSYIMGEMIGELNIGHAYVGGGDRPEAKKIKLGLLGADLSFENGYPRVEKLLNGANWSKNLRSPLTEVGVNVAEGDYLIAVNGIDMKDEVSGFYEALTDQAERTVELTVNSKPSASGARKVLVVPLADEAALRYHDWVRGNIAKVSAATDGKVGYIHVPDMGPRGLNEFVKHFFPQLNKNALIIDVRGNGGGNVSPMLIERLNRTLAMVNRARNTTTWTSPGETMIGPKVCLLDQYSASDGDLFPYRFRKRGLGKLIGQRSWGGVVGIRGSLPLIDGGYLRKPEFGKYNTEGDKWIIEGYGVDPDIEVIQDPAVEFTGKDQQLERGIEEILKELKTNPGELPKAPDYPDKSK